MNAAVRRGRGFPPLTRVCGAGRGLRLAAGNAGQGTRGRIAALDVRRGHDVGPGHGGAFGPGRPSSAPGSVTIVCEVIEGAGPHQPPGNRNRDGTAERPDS